MSSGGTPVEGRHQCGAASGECSRMLGVWQGQGAGAGGGDHCTLPQGGVLAGSITAILSTF